MEKTERPESESVASVAKKLGTKAAIAWADRRIELWAHWNKGQEETLRSLATMIVEKKADTAFAVEFARRALQLDEARRRGEIGPT